MSSYEWETKFKRDADGKWLEQTNGYGRVFKYQKKSVEEIRQAGFCGWGTIFALMDECHNTIYYPEGPDFMPLETRLQLQKKLRRRDRMLMITMFLTGGRISEVLMLRKANFLLDDGSKRRDGEDRILVRGMPLLKRIEVKKTLIDERSDVPPPEIRRFYQWDRRSDIWRRYEKTYTPIIRRREEFPIPCWEPFVDELIAYVNEVEDWLFPTTAKKARLGSNPGVLLWADEVFKLIYRPWISPVRAYQIVRSAGARLGMHVWDHWYRAQRGNQMRSNYQFRNFELEKYFGWKPRVQRSQAALYAGVPMQDVWRRMVEFKYRLMGELEESNLPVTEAPQ